jgi:hypothetical protein
MFLAWFYTIWLRTLVSQGKRDSFFVEKLIAFGEKSNFFNWKSNKSLSVIPKHEI